MSTSSGVIFSLEEILMAADFAFDTGKTVLEDAAIKEPIYHLFHIGPEKAILLGKTVVINLFKHFKIVFNTLIVL